VALADLDWNRRTQSLPRALSRGFFMGSAISPGLNIPQSLLARRRGDRITTIFGALHESAFGPKRTCLVAPHMSAFGGKADMTLLLIISVLSAG
jgi:hypothetical protein